MQKRKERRGTSGGGSDDFFKAKGIAGDAYDRKQKGERELERSHRKMGGSNDAAYNIRQKATRSQRYQEYRREGGKLSMQDWMKYQKESYDNENINEVSAELAKRAFKARSARLAKEFDKEDRARALKKKMQAKGKDTSKVDRLVSKVDAKTRKQSKSHWRTFLKSKQSGSEYNKQYDKASEPA